MTVHSPKPVGALPADRLLDRFLSVRSQSLALAAGLSDEDQLAQSMPDASPVKWHLGHTTWFFETFVLGEEAGWRPLREGWGRLFNSYYEALGARQPRPLRGLLTRPGAAEVRAYREEVDAAVLLRLERGTFSERALELLTLGLHHEQQHQELILTDVLHLLSQNPLEPAYRAPDPAPPVSEAGSGEARIIERPGGVVEVGADGRGFAFDNEGPRHGALLTPHGLADRLVTNGEYLEFIAAGGYRRPEFWLSDGWSCVSEGAWSAPLYWREEEGGWTAFGLHGRRPLDPAAPVRQLSFYEADAYARFRGARLPLEAEWESAAAELAVEGNLLEAGRLETAPAAPGEGLRQMFGDVWEWTSSPYQPYPGFWPAGGAVGEYNGKFMINQMVLKGGSLATPADHVRASYRNFFHPHQRWQFAGLRLAHDLPAGGPRGRGGSEEFRRDVVEGLSKTPKSIPSKYFYDARGSELFEAICELEEYYPTRTEIALLEAIAPELVAGLPGGGALVEFGSGSSRKTRLLLDAAPQIAVYAPVDISAAALASATRALAADYPDLEISPIVADFTAAVDWPAALRGRPRTGFFPGSTIGNFSPEDAEDFLARAGAWLGAGSRFILGVDLVKDEATLVRAYDDARGVTAAFNLNLLERMRRELGADVDPARFEHLALWNAVASRIEMHLRAREAHEVRVDGRRFAFAAGETIHTENSYKWDPAAFGRMCERAGWIVEGVWASPPPAFGVVRLRRAE